MSYRDEKQQNSARQGLLTKQSYRGVCIAPSFGKDSYVPTKIRWLGTPTADQKGFEPLRNSATAYDYTSAVISRAIASKVGTVTKVTFIADLYDDAGHRIDPATHQSPIRKFMDVYNFAKRTHPEWEALSKGGPMTGAPIGKIVNSAMIQGAIVEHNSKPYYDAPMFGTLYMQKSCTDEFEKILETETPNYNGDPDDWRARFQYANIMDPDTGSILSFRNRKFGAPQVQAKINFSGRSNAAVQQSGGGQDWTGFAVDVEPSPPLARLPDGRLELAVQGYCSKPWNEVLRYLSPEEQVAQLIRAFEDKPELIRYAFQSTGLLPSTFTGKVISVAPAAPASQGTGSIAESPAAQALRWPGAPAASAKLTEVSAADAMDPEAQAAMAALDQLTKRH